MATVIITGSAGLIGSETARRFGRDGACVVGIDNDMRSQFFGAEASTKKIRDDLIANVCGYEHHDLDIRDSSAVTNLFKEHRCNIEPGHEYEAGISETMSIDYTMHSLFGTSKAAADLLVQEYGRYFGMPTVSFRGGCLTGPAHAGTELHGFLSYLMICAVQGRPYRVFGYKGKQVRDNIHSFDLVSAFEEFIRAPRSGEVYNIGGSRHSNCSLLEAIELCEEISGRKLKWSYEETNRIGDHIWWISNVRKFQQHYPAWQFRYGLREMLEEIHTAVRPTQM